MNQICGTIIKIAVILTCVFLSFPATLSADEALKRYNEGIALYKSEHYIEAAKAFREAYALKSSWKLYYNIGQAEAAARRYGFALDAFEAYLVEGGDEIAKERRETILSEIEGFKLLVGTLEVVAPPGTALYMDGELRGTTPFQGAIRVAAGSHECVLKRDGEVVSERTVRILGETKSVLEMEDPEGTASTEAQPVTIYNAPPPSTARGPALTIAGGVIGGIGLVGVGVGIAFAVKASDDRKAAQDPDIDDEDEFNRKLDKFHTSRAVLIAGFAAGGTLLTTGIVLIVLDAVYRKKEKEPQKVSFVPTPGGIGLSF